MDRNSIQRKTTSGRGSGRLKTFGFAAFFAAVLMVPGQASSGSASASDPSFHLGRTPSQQHINPALRAYRNGFYGAAVRRFEKAAFWADKVAQYNVGVMHYRGEGVRRSPARAWAWLALAAERDYDLMAEAAASVWQLLEPGERAQAVDILVDELVPRYGDDVAVDRTARHMGLEFNKATGSRIGNSSTMLYIRHIRGPASYNKETHSLHYFAENWDGPTFYDPVLWDFEQVLRAENMLFDAGPSGRVDLLDLQIIEDDVDQRVP